jgi:hypothetical protein
MENKILVIYAGVAGLRSEDIGDFVHKLAKKLSPEGFQGMIITIPVQSLDTRIECINPKYITDKVLIKEHTEMIKKLNEELQYQLDQLKKENGHE